MASYKVKQGDIFGRVGSGIGRGLAESLPKEMERGRLASGLSQFEQESEGLSPMQQFTRLASIPGIVDRPQLIQTLGELAKNQGLRTSIRNNAKDIQPVKEKGKLDDVRFANLQERRNVEQATDNDIKTREQVQNENVPRESTGQSQILPKNPLREETKTVVPLSPEEFNQKISENWDSNPGLTFDQVVQKTNQDEERRKAMPEAERIEDERLKGIQKEIKEKFTDQLSTKLQKEGKGTFSDITGEMQTNLIRGMEHDLAKNPNLSVDDVVNRWTNKALNLAKTKTQLNKLANEQNSLAGFFKQGETIEKLQNYQKTFKDSDNSEEYFNILKKDFGMSPHSAAQIAYPRSDNVKQVIKKIPSISYTDQIKISKKIATDIEQALTRNDSLLAISKNIKDIDDNFNERAFFQQLSEDRDRLSLSEVQIRELGEGVPDWTPNWGDTWFFPNWRGLNK
jgi:hypothetical protein